ncbi:MAG: DUF2284 domain-containing protein [Firmicutes bacterium]|nr:DUF2284 domain-containing protein [Bacillota bacterium]
MHELIKDAVTNGAKTASIISTTEIPFDPELRKLCESNQCGNYGKSWTCPPDVGDVNELIKKAKSFDKALVFQTVSEIEDSYDFEGMMQGLKHHEDITKKIEKLVHNKIDAPVLQLSAGWCKVCDKCAKIDKKPCRHPEKAVASLESYGIFVSGLAEKAGMKYINGVNTVTYFGAFLY